MVFISLSACSSGGGGVCRRSGDAPFTCFQSLYDSSRAATFGSDRWKSSLSPDGSFFFLFVPLRSPLISLKLFLTSFNSSSISSDSFSSLVAFLNSRRARPKDLARSGSYLGPMTMSAMARIRSISGMPMPNMGVSLQDAGPRGQNREDHWKFFLIQGAGSGCKKH